MNEKHETVTKTLPTLSKVQESECTENNPITMWHHKSAIGLNQAEILHPAREQKLAENIGRN